MASKSARDAKITNFMSQFRDSTTKELKNLTSQQFINVWRNYDKDGKLTVCSFREWTTFTSRNSERGVRFLSQRVVRVVRVVSVE